jgi:hypothetical protein
MNVNIMGNQNSISNSNSDRTPYTGVVANVAIGADGDYGAWLENLQMPRNQRASANLDKLSIP